MSISSIELTPKQCAALLQSIVDCEPSLHEQIESCAKEYTDNPEQYEQDEEMMKLFYSKIVSAHQCQIGNIKHNGDDIIISWYHTGMDYDRQDVYNIKTKTFFGL